MAEKHTYAPHTMGGDDIATTRLQSLVDAHGRKIMPQLWENMALYDGFETLESTLLPYDDTVPGALARYRLQNIVRDYKFATFFDNDSVLWLEDTITSTGRWRPDGEGVQELGANYFKLDLDAGAFTVDLAGDNGQLELWALGVRGDEAEAIAWFERCARLCDAFDRNSPLASWLTQHAIRATMIEQVVRALNAREWSPQSLEALHNLAVNFTPTFTLHDALIAERVLATQGVGAWPTCGGRLYS